MSGMALLNAERIEREKQREREREEERVRARAEEEEREKARMEARRAEELAANPNMFHLLEPAAGGGGKKKKGKGKNSGGEGRGAGGGGGAGLEAGAGGGGKSKGKAGVCRRDGVVEGREEEEEDIDAILASLDMDRGITNCGEG